MFKINSYLENILITCTLICYIFCYAQEKSEQHIVSLQDSTIYVENNHFKQGTSINPKRENFTLNNFFLKKNKQPVLPIMGEFQYSRYPKKDWEKELLKMKASGIEIIGFYDFWIHHEEKEGEFRFDGNRDVRSFLKLIQKHGLKAVARIGPWVHGETRNGGYPDWFVKKYMKSGFDRASKNGKVKPEVKRWYKKLASQFQGLYYKDGGPIIGIQLDNEVHSNGPGSWGFEYQKTLKKIAQKAGMDVPFYVVTGWPGNNLPEDEVLPLWGGYPASPWTGNSKPLPPNKLYDFITNRKDKTIGNDILKYDKNQTNENTPLYRHPFLTVELGGGIQDTYQRRPIINPKDLMGIIYTRLGVGANMLGYYIYHGAQHPLSWNKEYGTQETKSSIYPYPNDYPIISYDFQAPLSEYGFREPSYNYFKRIHLFVKAYGSLLAPMLPTIPDDSPKDPKDFKNLRYSVRSKNGSGFIFINNYVRNHQLSAHKNVSFHLKNKSVSIQIPEKKGINIPEGTQAIFPFNLKLNDVRLNYATAQPVTFLKGKKTVYVFENIKGINAQFKFENKNIQHIKASAGKIHKLADYTLVDALKPGKNCVISIRAKSGKKIKILLLTETEALQTYVFNIHQKETLILTPQGAYYDETSSELHLSSEGVNKYNFYTYPAISLKNPSITKIEKEGFFNEYTVKLPVVEIPKTTFKEIPQTEEYKRYLDSLEQQTPSRPAYIIQYQKNNTFKNYRLKLPKQIPDGLVDVKLKLDYKGNTASLYANGLITADDYYNGKAMILSLERLQDKLDQNFILQITPLMKNSKIFFEPGTDLDFSAKEHAVLKNIESIPIYDTVLKE